jgi:diguanylate cyclase (GGDEF)-like protein
MSDVGSQARSSWQIVQDALSALAGVSLQTSTLYRPLCEASQENPICRLIHSIPEADQICNANRMRQMELALQTEEPVFFSCEANLHMFAIPILAPQEEPRILQGGKVYYTYSEFAEFQEQAGRLGLDSDQLLQAVQPTQFGSSVSLHETARLVQILGKVLIENTQLRKKFEERSGSLTTLMRILVELSPLSSRSDLFEGMLNALGVLYGIRSGVVLVEDPSEKEALVVQGTFGKLRGLLTDRRFPRTGLIEQILNTGESITSDVTFEILKIGLPKETGPIHLFPLKAGAKNTGVLLLLDTQLTTEEVQIIGTFVLQISPLLENFELRDRLSNRNKAVHLLSEITHVIGASLDSRELFRSILDRTTEFLQAEQGSLMVMEEGNNTLSIRAIKGLNKTIVEMLRIQPGEGISGKVYESGLPMLVQDISSDQRVSQPPRSRYKTRSFISAPLKLHNRTIGVINLADKTTGSPFSEGDLELLTAIGSYASVAIERSVYYQKTEELRKISITDHLTGLLNRRYFQERLIEEVERSRRHRLPVSLMIIDVDDFKSVNDTLGHPEGDEILKILTHAIRHYIRAIDVAARYGGEEFTIILPQTTKQDAAVIAERICRGIERNESFRERLKGRGGLTVSIGLAAYPDDASNIEELVRHADEALYSAKFNGKNRVVLYSPMD